jgi:predicted MFS family arabinose efflux permease
VLSPDQPGTRLATRLAFLVGGFGYACWAPLVPFAKARLGVDDGVFGLLLLCLGIGSIGAMLLTGTLSARLGSKPIVVVSSLGLSLTLPLLAIGSSPLTLGTYLFAFGAFLGSLDVAMNIHAVEVERAAKQPLMSGFHGMFSVGGLLGAAVMTFMLSMHIDAILSTFLAATVMVIVMTFAWPRFMATIPPQTGHHSAMPHGIVVLLAILTCIVFLIEGAILDWGALLITRMDLLSVAHSGLGYVVFSIAMTIGRFAGDAVVARVGDRAALFWGSLVAITGFAVLLLVPATALAMGGFLLIGFGASNIVPVLFRKAGSQHAMPAALAIAAVTTVGYAGILVGPAAIGFVAKAVGLQTAFWMLAALMAVITLSARTVTRESL